MSDPKAPQSRVPTIDALRQRLEGTFLEGCVEVATDGTPWLRYDIDDCDPKDQWAEYCDVSDQLKSVGLVLEDPCIEHDCISGDVHWINGPVS